MLTTVRAIVATAPGGPDVLDVRELPDPTPGPAQVLVRVAAAGVNFIDTYRRSGLYTVCLLYTSDAADD